ncbi:MAG TPA: VWA domain-containing protein [Solirubrobacteraceae bacterium]|nr:VWA domain-containing protein [Solirubrobacteraceae bacterium]
MIAFARALARDAPLAAVALGRALHDAGVPVTPDRSARFAAAAALAPPRDRSSLYWTARLAFVSSHQQLDAFDAVFRAVVDGLAEPLEPPRPPSRAQVPVILGPGGDGEGEPGGQRVATLASDAERLATTELGELEPRELDALAALLRSLAAATPPRRARRAQVARRGERLDVRATLRRARRTGGDPVRHERRRRRERARPLVALLDVSGSMEPYARAYLLFLEGAARGAGAEAFVFATRLTRVTRALREGRPHEALDRAARAATDFSGGTRIGAALKAFNDRWGRRGMARDAVVVVVSDGWERGDPALVGREMERLRRLAYRIVWVNPRAAAPGFEPIAGGMAAALPHVDELLSGHTALALGEVVEAMGRTR